MRNIRWQLSNIGVLMRIALSNIRTVKAGYLPAIPTANEFYCYIVNRWFGSTCLDAVKPPVTTVANGFGGDLCYSRMTSLT